MDQPISMLCTVTVLAKALVPTKGPTRPPRTLPPPLPWCERSDPLCREELRWLLMSARSLDAGVPAKTAAGRCLGITTSTAGGGARCVGTTGSMSVYSRMPRTWCCCASWPMKATEKNSMAMSVPRLSRILTWKTSAWATASTGGVMCSRKDSRSSSAAMCERSSTPSRLLCGLWSRRPASFGECCFIRRLLSSWTMMSQMLSSNVFIAVSSLSVSSPRSSNLTPSVRM
mmetsp:Transcript_7010/g.22523  ORF Transcript_7010/g.22523 Transcript_7010/m.22523 type:complete len:229 (+) Transcript_7010:232-918(+)